MDQLCNEYERTIIKFRGNLKTTGEAVFGGFFQHSKVLLCPVGITEDDIKNNQEYLIALTVKDDNGKGAVKMYEVDPKTVSLFTNYYDKDNTEIYTGDTVMYEGKEYIVKYELGAFYLESVDKKLYLKGMWEVDMQVLKDRPVEPSCLNLDHIDIKAKATHNDTWYRGGCSYDEATNQMNVLLNNGVGDWNLPVSISAMPIQPDTCGLFLGVIDEDDTSAYTGDIIEFTEDIDISSTTRIKKNTRATIHMFPGEVCVRTSERIISLQELIKDGKKLDKAVIVHNVHDLEEAD